MNKRRIIIVSNIVVSIAIFSVLLAYFYSIINQPQSAKVSISQTKSSYQTIYNVDLTPVKTVGHYISFNSPKGVPIYSKSLAGDNSLEDYVFYTKDTYSWTLAIEVSKLPSGNLDQDSSYTYRKNNPQIYSENTQTINGNSIIIMTDKSFSSGLSKVAFLIHGTEVGSVSLVGGDALGTQPLQTSLDMVLNSWQWL